MATNLTYYVHHGNGLFLFYELIITLTILIKTLSVMRFLLHLQLAPYLKTLGRDLNQFLKHEVFFLTIDLTNKKSDQTVRNTNEGNVFAINDSHLLEK